MPSPSGTNRMLISPGAGSPVRTITIEQVDWLKITSRQVVSVLSTEYGPVVLQSAEYWLVVGLMTVTVKPEIVARTEPRTTLPVNGTVCKVLPRLSLMLSKALSALPTGSMAENLSAILHLLSGAIVWFEQVSVETAKSPASASLTEAVPKVIAADPLLVTRTGLGIACLKHHRIVSKG